MKKFLLKIFIFSLPWLILLALAEVYVESLPNIARYKHSWMLQHGDEVTTLILGHSHTLYGVRPDVLGKGTFSLAQQSQSLRYDAYLLKHYPLKNLRKIILPFSYSSLWEDFEHQPGEKYQAMRYRIYMDCDIHPRISWYGFEIMSMPAVREKLKSLYTPAQNGWDSLGWGNDYTLQTREKPWDNGKIRAEKNTYKDTSIIPLNEGFLREIFEECRKRDIKVILLNTPVSPNFRKWEDRRQVNINQQILSELLKTYPEVDYLDWEDDPRFCDEDFYDGDHLNSEGAKKLTRFIKSEMSKRQESKKEKRGRQKWKWEEMNTFNVLCLE
ncbi:MAG: hypothetical protein GXY64_11885 [Bacteroidales bacterium]|nr:hypothetical protein [Bacteroidales bacterium]